MQREDKWRTAKKKNMIEKLTNENRVKVSTLSSLYRNCVKRHS